MPTAEDRIRTIIQQTQEWIQGCPVPELEAHVFGPAATSDQVAAIEEVVRGAGYPMSPTFVAAISLGATRAPVVRELGLGICLSSPDRIFEHYLNGLSEISAGIAQGGSWLVFATEHGSLQPAYAFDRRFIRGEEIAVASYHEDMMAAESYGDEEALPECFPDYGDWLAYQLGRYREAVLVPRTAEVIRRELEELEEASGLDVKPSSWRQRWDTCGDLDQHWDFNSWPDQRRVLRESDDASVVDAIMARVDVDLRGHGKKIVPGLSQDRSSGFWTTGLPGPVDLIARLPERERRQVAWWALRHCGVKATTSTTSRAFELLESDLGDDHERRNVMFACADEGWIDWRTRDVSLEILLARTLAWALGDLRPSRLEHVLANAHKLRQRTCADDGLSMFRNWSRLKGLCRGVPLPDGPQTRKGPSSALAQDFAQWASAFDGTQREKLAQVEVSWLERARRSDTATQKEFAALVRKVIKSKSLTAARDELLARLTE